MKTETLCRRLGTAALVVVLAAGGAVVGRAAEGDPSLRLFVSKSDATVVRRDSRRPVHLDHGLYTAPVGGAFELRVTRPKYREPLEVEQLVHSPSGDVRRPLPDESVTGADHFTGPHRGDRRLGEAHFPIPGGAAGGPMMIAR